MASFPRHKLAIYPAAEQRMALDRIAPVETWVYDDLDQAIAGLEMILEAIGDPFAANLRADADHSSLEEYLRANNAVSTWLEANPVSGCWVSGLMPAEDWREMGITTARQLEDYLLGVEYSERHKAEHGCRPARIPESRDELERLLAAY